LVESEETEKQKSDEDYSKRSPLTKARWREDFPRPAGVGIRQEATAFEILHNTQIAQGESIWGTFKDKGDWNLALWILESGTTRTDTDKFLKLKKVSLL
jgi:hypothetical protein